VTAPSLEEERLAARQQPLVAEPTLLSSAVQLDPPLPSSTGAEGDAEMKVDINYLFLRQQTETSRAKTATSDVARRIHEQLANEYERLIEDATAGRVSFVRPMQSSQP
jgi:hypothetical protein